MANDDYAARIRQRLMTGQLLDPAFDALLPTLMRARSRQYWTPVSVARRAAQQFEQAGASRVLDVGCGPGKFCIVASFARPSVRFVGVDRRASLVQTAKDISRQLQAQKTEFVAGDARDVDWLDFDGFYFFNPFAESALELDCDFDVPPDCAFSPELLGITSRLARARLGTVVVTYHGMGGPIPSTYDLIAEEPAGGDRIHTWIKARYQEDAWYHLELEDGVFRIPTDTLKREPRVPALREKLRLLR